MNVTVINCENGQTPTKPSFFNEVLFFAKASVVMGAIILLVTSAWV
ncbi:hypothetical protein VHP8226_02897 [Vibrio hippocampi]|uniref:Uncharacterized protein n=1 Tax=Vibrio hippocampi TaxID=654686 RepID=A0ABN8DMS1_9VIBR|nr:hypothetical protein VHP8226_02897 [Vibrio hippocampi]